eukprot:5004469-Pleurochrysis_carterae.AAC.11
MREAIRTALEVLRGAKKFTRARKAARSELATTVIAWLLYANSHAFKRSASSEAMNETAKSRVSEKQPAEPYPSRMARTTVSLSPLAKTINGRYNYSDRTWHTYDNIFNETMNVSDGHNY